MNRAAWAALVAVTAALPAAIALRAAGVIPAQTPYCLADLRWILLAQVVLVFLARRSRSAAPDRAAGRARAFLPAAVIVVLAGAAIYGHTLTVFLHDPDDWAPIYLAAWIGQGGIVDRLGIVIGDVILGRRPTSFTDVLMYLGQFGVYAAAGDAPWAYRGLSLAVLLGAALTVVFLARRLGAGPAGAGAAGLFFALYPPNHEIVTLPSFFNFGLSVLCVNGALLALPGATVQAPAARRILAASLFAVGLLFKETALVLIILAPILLAVEDGAGLRAAMRRHRRTLAPLAAVTAVFLVAAILGAAGGRRADADWNTATYGSALISAWSAPGHVLSLFTQRLPVNLFTYPTQDLMGAAFPWTQAALAAVLAIVIFVLAATSMRRGTLLFLAATMVLSAAPAASLWRWPNAYMEKTHYFIGPSVGVALAFGFFAQYAGQGARWRGVAARTIAAALLVFNVLTLGAVFGVRAWFGGMLQRSAETFVREYAALQAGEEVWLVCDGDGLDRGGMDVIVFHNALRNRLDKPINLIAAVRFDEPGEAPAGGDPVRLAPDGATRLFGWDRDTGVFRRFSGDDLERLVARQPGRRAGPLPSHPVLVESPAVTRRMRAEIHTDVTPARIIRRM